ncbi:MAG TPA: sigma-E factor regulatory protein RseB domain-containing protein [Elusimicrobiota bacterium]|nr:sigma-E factor regulatory protein RseB domain-containing protein [Elusimicrobiota bacterium]
MIFKFGAERAVFVSAAAALFLFSPIPNAAAARLKRPDPLEALRKSLEGPAVPYQGEVKIQNHARQSREISSVVMNVFWANDSHYHREIKDKAGNLRQVIVADGGNEWIYDPEDRKAWKGPIPADSRGEIESELRLISANYAVKISPGRRIAGRPTWLIEFKSRATGALARRLWLDRQYWLSLESELFRPNRKVGSSMRFTSVSFNPELPKTLFAFKPPAGWQIIPRLAPRKISPENGSAAGGARELPAWLPSGYAFESEDALRGGKNPVWHDRFSDGINVLSLFQCSDEVQLDFGTTGAEPVQMASTHAKLAWTQDGLVLSWSRGGRRFVLIGPLDLTAIERVAESVP